MQEPTDNQLDGLFRKSAEEFDVPYDPAAWQALKNRLDAHDQLTVWEHVLRWGLPVLLLVVLTAGSWNANRKQVKASQTLNSGVAMGQSVSVDKDSLTNSAVLQHQQRVDNSQLYTNEAALSDLSKVDGHTKDAIDQPGNNERPVGAAQANETVANADESVVLSTTNKRGSPTTLTATDRSSKSGKPTTRTERSDLPDPEAGPSTVIDPSSRISADRANSNKLAATVERIGRTRSSTVRQRQMGQGVENGTKNSLVATLSVTDRISGSERAFTKRRQRPDASGESLAKKQESGNRSLRTVQAVEYLSGATTTPVSTQATIDKAEQPALPVSFIELTSKPGQWPKPLPFIGRDITAPANPIAPETTESKQSLSTKPAPMQRGMSVRFMVSPDLSAIGLRNFQRPGTNVGLLLEYRLASRWSVQVGVIRSTKVYKASTADYVWPASTSKWRVFPQSVNGRCNLLDIPINLRYDVVIRPRLDGLVPSRWFVSGGVTTYIMQKEDYDYNYAEADKIHVYPNAYPSMTGWHGKTGGYGFSQLNLSMGYEQALSRRLSWQVEPFVKVPLKGVGYFKVDLLSTGAFFSLRYKL